MPKDAGLFFNRIFDVVVTKIFNYNKQTVFNQDHAAEGRGEFICYGQLLLTDLNSAPQILIPDDQVPKGCKCYVTDIRMGETAGAAAAGGTSLKLQDTNGTPVDFITFAGTIGTTLPAGANIFYGYNVGTTTYENALKNMTGGTASKGLQWKGAGTFTGSCRFNYMVKGYFAP